MQRDQPGPGPRPELVRVHIYPHTSPAARIDPGDYRRGSSTMSETLPLYIPPSNMADYWRETIGDTYKPVKWNPRWADHPVRVREVLAKLKAGDPCPEAADVICGLIHSMCMSKDLQSSLSELVIKLQQDAEGKDAQST